MTFQTSSNDLLTVSPYLVAPNANGGRFTSIQDAMDAAVAELSPSPARPAVILIKAGTYLESLTIPNGIILEGLDRDGVIINGLITVSGVAQVQLVNLSIERTTGDSFSFIGGTITLRRCSVSTVAGQTFDMTTVVNKTLVIERSSFLGDGASSLFNHDGLASVVLVTSNNSSYQYSLISTFPGPLGSFTFSHTQDRYRAGMLFTGAFNLAASFLHCDIQNVGATDFVSVTDAATTGTFMSVGNKILLQINTQYFSTASSTIKPTYVLDDTFTTSDLLDDVLGVSTPRGLNWETLSGSTSDPTNGAGVFFSTPRTGFANAEMFQTCGYLQVVGITTGDIFTSPSKLTAIGKGFTLFGIISGKRSDNAEYIGGHFFAVARSAVLVGSDFSNILSDSGAPPSISALSSGGDIIIRITQSAAVTWNYSATFFIQQLQNEG